MPCFLVGGGLETEDGPKPFASAREHSSRALLPIYLTVVTT